MKAIIMKIINLIIKYNVRSITIIGIKKNNCRALISIVYLPTPVKTNPLRIQKS